MEATPGSPRSAPLREDVVVEGETGRGGVMHW